MKKSMLDLIRKFKNSISFKISLLNSVFFCLTFFVILVIVYGMNYNIIESKETKMLDSYIFNSLVTVDDKLLDMGRVSKMTMSEARTQEIVANFSSKSLEEKRLDEKYLNNFYTSLISIRDDITGLYMFDDQSIIFYRDVANPSQRHISQTQNIPEQIAEMEAEPMLVANCKLIVDVQPKFMIFGEYYTSNPYYNNCIWLTRDIYSFSPYEKIGSVAIISPVKVMTKILNERLGEHMFYTLMTQSGEIVCSQNSELLGQDIQTVNNDIYKIITNGGPDGNSIANWNGEKIKLVYQTSKNSGLILVAGSPTQYITQEAAGFLKYFYLLCFLAVVFIVASTFHNTGKILLPLKKLAHGMVNFNRESIKTRYPVLSADETGQLVAAFNRMMDMLENLIKSQYEDKMKIRESQLKEQQLSMLYLKNQVNPHFLYNTLDNIRIRAEINNDKDVSYMLKSLVDFFRLNVKADNELVTLEHEIKLIKVYLKLMCYRYPEIKCQYQVDENLLEIQVPNFILQPIVENSLMHGLRNKGYRGTIQVSVFSPESRPDLVEIKISDNGVGFDAKTRHRVNRMLESLPDNEMKKFGTEINSIGIINVQRRLKIYYNEECGLSYSDNQDGGITAHIVVRSKVFKKNKYDEEDVIIE